MSRDYREKDVIGCIVDENKPIPLPRKCNVVVRMTSDKVGQTLSFQAFNIMISIPLESVREIIKVSEKEQK